MTTNNNQQNARRFEPQYKGILTAVFNAKSAFSGAFAPIQSVDGITSNTKAFSVKTNATPVVIGTYSKDANVYQAVVDLTNATSLKGATVSLDNNTVPKYKGFKLEETPDKYFVSGEVAYFTADQVAIPFIGIATARTIDVEAFDGKALQAHAKGGQFMLDDNKKAVLKATAPKP